VLVPFTGVLSDFGEPLARAAELAVEEINEAGGVLGQDVELVRGDAGSEPVLAQEEARRLIEVEGVSAIIGAAASEVTLAVAESVTVPNGIVQISPASTVPLVSVVDDGDFLFRTVISDAAQAEVLAHLADEMGFSRACTTYTDDLYGQGVSEQFAEAFARRGGTVTAHVPQAAGEEFPGLEGLSECVQSDPEVLVVMSYWGLLAGEFLEEALAALEAQQIGTFLFAHGTNWSGVFEMLGWDSFEGMYGTALGSLKVAAGTAFDNAYEAEYGEEPPLPFMREAYDAVYVIALAAEKAGSTDPRAIRDALRDIANPPGEVVNPGVEGFAETKELIAAGEAIDYEGATGVIEFDDKGDVLQGAIEIWQIREGEIVEAVRTFEVDLSTKPPTVEVTQ